MNQLQTFKKAHTRIDGTFDNELAEQQYNQLRLEFESQTEPNSDGEYEESSEPLPNAVPIFQKVLGPRRDVTRWIGLKPKVSLLPSSSGVNHDEQEHTPPPPITQAQYANLFQDPNFIHCLDEYINQIKGSSKGNEDDSDEGEDDSV